MTQSENQREKRRDFRTSYGYGLWYRKLNERSPLPGDWVRTVTRDLSGGGASFFCQAPEMLPDDCLVEMQVLIPPKPVFVIGKVVRSSRENGHPVVAVEFLALEDADKDRIVRTVLNDGLERRDD